MKRVIAFSLAALMLLFCACCKTSEAKPLADDNPRLHSDEVLLALAISGLTNPLAALAQEQLDKLSGSEAHFSVIISEEDIQLYKSLGIHVTCEPHYEVKRFYHK